MNYYSFCDLSEWNGPVDMRKVKDLYKFVYLRACWGTNKDARFDEYKAGAEAVGIPWGAYAYLDWRFSVAAQAIFFNSLLNKDPGQLAPVLDLEMDPSFYTTKYGGIRSSMEDYLPKTRKVIGAARRPLKYRLAKLGPYTMTKDVVEGNVWNWLTAVEKSLGVIPEIYTGYYYWLQWMTSSPNWAKYKLWLAWYAAESVIKVPPPYTTWDMWQYSGNGNGSAIGQGKSLDVDWAKALPVPVAPPAPLLCPTCHNIMPAGWSYTKPA